MSLPIGATHALEDLIWRKPLPPLEPGRFYDVRACDTVTGGVVGKSYHLSDVEVLSYIERHRELKVFVYEE